MIGFYHIHVVIVNKEYAETNRFLLERDKKRALRPWRIYFNSLTSGAEALHRPPTMEVMPALSRVCTMP